ncbi:hypothetical protein CGRA01v4_04948 [Colletotrichum graminicola]|nr:hypothetical protein CGRA01v4_04948 [Colletotrichum graminicola]
MLLYLLTRVLQKSCHRLFSSTSYLALAMPRFRFVSRFCALSIVKSSIPISYKYNSFHIRQAPSSRERSTSLFGVVPAYLRLA